MQLFKEIFPKRKRESPPNRETFLFLFLFLLDSLWSKLRRNESKQSEIYRERSEREREGGKVDERRKKERVKIAVQCVVGVF